MQVEYSDIRQALISNNLDLCLQNYLPNQYNVIEFHGADTMTHVAARAGSIKILEFLLASGALFDIPNQYGMTPLMEAYKARKVNAFRYLLLYGANQKVFFKNGFTLAQQICYDGHPEFIDLCKEFDFDFISRGKGGLSTIYVALRSHDKWISNYEKNNWILNMFRQKKINLEYHYYSPKDGTGVMHLAASTANTELMKILIRGAIDNHRVDLEEILSHGDKSGRTPIMYSAFTNNLETLKVVSEVSKQLLYEVDQAGLIAIEHAIKQSHFDIARFILDTLEISAEEDCGYSMLSLSINYKYINEVNQAFQFFLDYFKYKGINPKIGEENDYSNIEGSNIIHHVCQLNHHLFLQQFLIYYDNCNIVEKAKFMELWIDSNGLNAFQLAINSKSYECVELIVKEYPELTETSGSHIKITDDVRMIELLTYLGVIDATYTIWEFPYYQWKKIATERKLMINQNELVSMESVNDIPVENFVLLENGIAWDMANLTQYIIQNVKGQNQYDQYSPYAGKPIWTQNDLNRLYLHPLMIPIENNDSSSVTETNMNKELPNNGLMIPDFNSFSDVIRDLPPDVINGEEILGQAMNFFGQLLGDRPVVIPNSIVSNRDNRLLDVIRDGNLEIEPDDVDGLLEIKDISKTYGSMLKEYLDISDLYSVIDPENMTFIYIVGSVCWARGPPFEKMLQEEFDDEELMVWEDHQRYLGKEEMPMDLPQYMLDEFIAIKKRFLLKLWHRVELIKSTELRALQKLINSDSEDSNWLVNEIEQVLYGQKCIMEFAVVLVKAYRRYEEYYRTLNKYNQITKSGLWEDFNNWHYFYDNYLAVSDTNIACDLLDSSEFSNSSINLRASV